MHAQLPIAETVRLMGSNSVEGIGAPLVVGNNFHVSVVAKDKAEADRAFALLSDGGKVFMPLANAPWGPYDGTCVDRFGVQWRARLPHPACRSARLPAEQLHHLHAERPRQGVRPPDRGRAAVDAGQGCSQAGVGRARFQAAGMSAGTSARRSRRDSFGRTSARYSTGLTSSRAQHPSTV